MSSKNKIGKNVERDDFFYVLNDNYDEHAELAIPQYKEMHEEMVRLIMRKWDRSFPLKLLDLGAGTGKTTEVILRSFPNGESVAVDKFPEMLNHARVRLDRFKCRVSYIEDDFLDADLGSNYNVCASALAIHHQDALGKQQIFNKVYNALEPGGIFVMIDWTTFSDEALNEAAFEIAEEHVRATLTRHPKIMSEWVHHWRNLNIPSTVEDMLLWLRECGFSHANCISRYYGMAFICAVKSGH